MRNLDISRGCKLKRAISLCLCAGFSALYTASGFMPGVPAQKVEAGTKTHKTSVKTLGLQKPVRNLAGSARAVLVIGLAGSDKPVRGVYLSRIGSSPLVFTHGLKPSDIIISVNGKRTKDPASLDSALANLQGQEYVVHVARNKGSSLKLYKAPVGTKSSSRHGVIPVPKIPIGIPIPKASFRPKEVDSLKQMEQAQTADNVPADVGGGALPMDEKAGAEPVNQMAGAMPVNERTGAMPVDTVPFARIAPARSQSPMIASAASEPGLPQGIPSNLPERLQRDQVPAQPKDKSRDISKNPANSQRIGHGQELSKASEKHNAKHSAGITDNEMYMISLVNGERKKHGLGALKPSNGLTRVARSHSEDMARRRFFSHITPDGKNPADRVRASGINYTYLAENIATENWQESERELVERAHKSLMKSTHHRENILRPGITSIGIGVSRNHKGGINVTQLFQEI